jgi:hypothetical protein
VVRDDVEEDLDPAAVRVVDQLPQLVVRAQVGIDLGEVRDPVAVVAGGLPLDRPVLEDRGHPQRGHAEALQVVELGAQAREIAAVVVALVGGIEARGLPVAGQPAAVVGGVAVGEPVGHDEVEGLLREGRPQAVAGRAAGALAGLRGSGHRARHEGGSDQQRRSEHKPHSEAQPIANVRARREVNSSATAARRAAP